jgi:hypothetical protein
MKSFDDQTTKRENEGAVETMTNTQTTTTKKTNHYVRALVALAALAMLVSLLMLTQAAKPVHAAANTFTVNFNGDLGDVNPGDGICDATSTANVCTLRATIQEANATLGADTINFNIPEAFGDPSSGVAAISPQTALPAITEVVIIDGYTQPEASPNTKTVGNSAVLKIQLDGTNVPNDIIGLEIDTSDGSVIKGLVINRFGTGISIRGDSVANRIEGNFIGTDPTGTLDVGNQIDGVQIFDGPSETVIGGTALAARNVISGNDDSGLALGSSQGTRVLGNRIGTTASGTAALGNAFEGVQIGNSSDSLLGDGTSAGSNTIAFNGRDGVNVAGSSSGNEVSRNSIFSNAGLGIDLVGPGETAVTTSIPTPNDPGDADAFANNLQNKPVLSSAKTGGGKTTIQGKLDSTPNQTYTIEFYSNPADTNEGKKFIGEKSVTTSVDGLRSFTFSPATSVPVGQTITATATRASTHDTSEFSAPKKVVAS